MRTIILIFVVTVRVFAQAQTQGPQTVCRWDNFRDGVHFGSVSNRKQISNVFDCANALADYFLRWEPLRGNTMFDGTVVLQSAEGEELGRCETKTIKPITEQERRLLPFFVTVGTEAEGLDFSSRVPGIPWKTEEKSAETLRSSQWQQTFRQYFEVRCEAKTS